MGGWWTQWQLALAHRIYNTEKRLSYFLMNLLDHTVVVYCKPVQPVSDFYRFSLPSIGTKVYCCTCVVSTVTVWYSNGFVLVFILCDQLFGIVHYLGKPRSLNNVTHLWKCNPKVIRMKKILEWRDLLLCQHFTANQPAKVDVARYFLHQGSTSLILENFGEQHIGSKWQWSHIGFLSKNNVELGLTWSTNIANKLT